MDDPLKVMNINIPVVFSGNNTYIAGHNMLKAHASAYRLYQMKYQASQKGKFYRIYVPSS